MKLPFVTEVALFERQDFTMYSRLTLNSQFSCLAPECRHAHLVIHFEVKRSAPAGAAVIGEASVASDSLHISPISSLSS